MIAAMMTESQPHVESFDEFRPLLFGIAWRMLGNPSDAEDVLQEALLRWMRTIAQEIRSPRAFLVTMVTRLCLNHLDLARVKKEVSFETDAPADWLAIGEINPAKDEDLAEALDAAFSVVLRCLSPLERAVFLLREVFECEYAEVARIVEKSEENCRQILRRARERISNRDARFQVTMEQQEAVLREFLSASASGDLDRLAEALAGDATLVRDGENLGAPAPAPLHGLAAVSEFLAQNMARWRSWRVQFQKWHFREVPLILVYREGKLLNALALVLRGPKVRAIYSITCPVRLRSLAPHCPALDSGANLEF
jgi:RNA polymerase sigma-70 factor (ECF subfamily)